MFINVEQLVSKVIFRLYNKNKISKINRNKKLNPQGIFLFYIILAYIYMLFL